MFILALKTFSKVIIPQDDQEVIIRFLKHDKKNSYGVVKFVLLEAIGQPKIDCEVSNETIIEAFAYYNSLNLN